MPSKLLSLGLMVLLIGAICLAVGGFKLGTIEVVAVEQKDSDWSLAANLTHGNTYGIDIQSSDAWGIPFGRGDFTEPMPANITITSPEGDVTRLQAFFWGEKSTSSYYERGSPPVILEVNYQNVDSVGLAVDNSTAHIRFMPKQDGFYNVTILKDGFWSQEPPDYILLLKEATPERETYSVVATVGGAMSTLGGVICLASLFKGRNVKRRSRR